MYLKSDLRTFDLNILGTKIDDPPDSAGDVPTSFLRLLGRTIVRSNTGSIMLSLQGLDSAPGAGVNRSASLSRDMRMPKFGGVSGMSRSGRF